MKTSYHPEDVAILLKDLSGQIEPQDTQQREQQIQNGVHYSEMLPLEHWPSEDYLNLYQKSLKRSAPLTASAIKIVAEKILAKKGPNVVLVSLARAGIPVGILIKRYLAHYHQLQVPHFAISIIRGRGIDENAIAYILKRHPAKHLQFVDGWTGKGAIAGQLTEAVQQWGGLSDELAVLADPAWMTALCGTHEDFLIPSACLNATVSGLMSRTILNKQCIGPSDFHGAVYFSHLAAEDRSYEFIETIEQLFPQAASCSEPEMEFQKGLGLTEAKRIAGHFHMHDLNLVKPGVGETTRVLLRRVPWKVLIQQGEENNQELAHILKLAEEKQVEVISYPLKAYRACGLIRNLHADL